MFFRNKQKWMSATTKKTDLKILSQSILNGSLEPSSIFNGPKLHYI